MSFEFSQEDLSKADERAVFNGGKTGRVTNVKVTMEDDRQTKTNENAPNFRVHFEDENGNKMNKACFDIKEHDYPNQWGKTYQETMKKEWAFLNKLVEHSGGTPVMAFSDDTDLYEKVMNSMGTKPVNVFANYGSTRSPKDRIEIRKWMPAVEAGDTTEADSKLKPTSLDQMNEVVADAKTQEDVENTLF